ncbi:MAG: hypothetical protein ABS987_05960, partial [Ruminococcus sp.]
EAFPISDGQQEDRFACPLPSHCRRRLFESKIHLLLPKFIYSTVSAGSAPPSPREKAFTQSNVSAESQDLSLPSRFVIRTQHKNRSEATLHLTLNSQNY